MDPSEIKRVHDLEMIAAEVLPRRVFDYFQRGAGDEETLYNNSSAFNRIYLRPRVLQDVSTIDTTTSVLGQEIKSPVCIAPTAMHKMAHPDGEVATAKAALSKSVCVTLSSLSTTKIEEIQEAIPDGLKWFQLSVHPDKNITEDLVHRAEKSGFAAVVFTVDVPLPGLRPYFTKEDKNPLPSHIKLVNYPEGTLPDGPLNYKDIPQLFDSRLTWSDVDWLKTITNLPVILKGIMTKEDAELAVAHHVDAVWVSNHGGRQLDGVQPTIDVLPEVVKAVDGKAEVYIDGGVQSGQNVFKALALGARAVFIGRPIVWGLACDGQAGVEKVLDLYQKELENTMGLSGCSKISDINSSHVTRQCLYCM